MTVAIERQTIRHKESLKDKVENYILNLALEEIEKITSFKSSKEERISTLWNIGRLGRIVDDLQDDPRFNGKISDCDLEKLIMSGVVSLNNYSGECKYLLEQLLIHRREIFNNVKDTPYYNNFLEAVKNCFDCQKPSGVTLKREELRNLSEMKGGSFALAILYALNPIGLTSRMERGIYWGGAWVQMLDEYFDLVPDKMAGISTYFTLSDNPRKDLFINTYGYRGRIKDLFGNSNIIIPIADKLTSLASISHAPVLSRISLAINH